MTSRATADCQSPEAERTSTTAPSVSAARNVMMAMTASSARPEIEVGRNDRGFAVRQRVGGLRLGLVRAGGSSS